MLAFEICTALAEKKIDCLWLDEVMYAQAELRCVVENTGPQMIRHGVRARPVEICDWSR